MFDLNNTDIFNEHCLPTTLCVRKYGDLQVRILGRERLKKSKKKKGEGKSIVSACTFLNVICRSVKRN